MTPIIVKHIFTEELFVVDEGKCFMAVRHTLGLNDTVEKLYHVWSNGKRTLVRDKRISDPILAAVAPYFRLKAEDYYA